MKQPFSIHATLGLGILVLGACETRTPEQTNAPTAVSATTEKPLVVSSERSVKTGAVLQKSQPQNRQPLEENKLRVRLAELPKIDEPLEPTFQDTKQHRKLVGLSNSFPWAGDRKGGWSGTGHSDPEPLKKYSDADMLKMASDQSDHSDDRQHALVSVGRRKMPGALAALEAALLDHKAIYQVREMGLSGLIEHGGPEALKLMWRALKEDPSDIIRGMAIWGIALYGTAESEAAVMHGLSDEDSRVKAMAVLAVWAIKDRREKALSILEDTAKMTERLVWQEALNVLARMPYPEAGDLLFKIAKNETGDKQHSAVSYYRTWLRNYPDLVEK